MPNVWFDGFANADIEEVSVEDGSGEPCVSVGSVVDELDIVTIVGVIEENCSPVPGIISVDEPSVVKAEEYSAVPNDWFDVFGNADIAVVSREDWSDILRTGEPCVAVCIVVDKLDIVIDELANIDVVDDVVNVEDGSGKVTVVGFIVDEE